ncbi:MAG: hypothetical protein MUP60_04690, partial [Candidatus Thorarchaeota archaeon]|nr:hypothetical protein [Candidatus Thorarchaeota archaeon]
MECQELVLGNQDNEKTTILIEQNRGLLHVRFSGNPALTKPPWYADRWESIFVGKDSDLFHNVMDMIDIYRVEPYVSLFFVGSDSYHVRHLHVPIVGTALEFSLLSDLATDYRRSVSPILEIRKTLTTHLENAIIHISGHVKEQIPEINEKTRTRLAQIVAHQTSVFGRIFPLLLDEMTEEVYMDGPNSQVYFDHQKMGRCVTSSTFDEAEVPRIVTFLRAESNLHLDRSNPSLKMELELFGLVLRVSASVPPLSSDGLSLEIRRARKQP